MDLLRPRPLAPPQAPPGPSLFAAIAITVAMLVMATVAGRQVGRVWWDGGATPVEERITYVAPPVPVPRPAPVPRAVAPTSPAGTATATRRATAPTAIVPTAPIVTPTTIPGAAAPDTGLGRRAAGAAATGAAASGASGAIVRGPTRDPLVSGATLPAASPLTRAQMDSALRDMRAALFTPEAVRAAVQEAKDAKGRADAAHQSDVTRATGAPVLRAVPVVSIKFGGKSPAEQRRDSIADADTRVRLARVQARADSVAAKAKRDSARAFVP